VAVLLEELVVAFGNAKDFIDRFNPIARKGFFMEERVEGALKRGVEPLGLAEECVGASRVILGQSEELGAAIRRDDSSNQKKTEKFLPGEIGGRVEFVGKIEGESSTDEVNRWRRVSQGVYLHKPVREEFVNDDS
jgi:hypothetical protein